MKLSDHHRAGARSHACPRSTTRHDISLSASDYIPCSVVSHVESKCRGATVQSARPAQVARRAHWHDKAGAGVGVVDGTFAHQTVPSSKVTAPSTCTPRPLLLFLAVGNKSKIQPTPNPPHPAYTSFLSLHPHSHSHSLHPPTQLGVDYLLRLKTASSPP